MSSRRWCQAGGMFRGVLLWTLFSSPVQAESRCPDRLTLCSDCYRAPVLTTTATRRAGSLHLPAIMRKRLVGVRHLVRILALLHRVALVGRSVEQLARQLLLH